LSVIAMTLDDQVRDRVDPEQLSKLIWMNYCLRRDEKICLLSRRKRSKSNCLSVDAWIINT
jgi:hypothetical protein